MKLSLIVLNAGKSEGQVIPIGLAQFVIGRDPQCNLRPGSALISKRHCAILTRNGSVFVRDFDSTNGTILNNEPLKGEIAVKHGDLLKVGPLEFRIAIEGAVASSKTPTPSSASPKKTTPLPPSNEPSYEDASHDDIAAMMLDMDQADGTTKHESSVPDGSTIMDMPIPAGLAETAKMPAQKPADEKKIPVGSAQNAAQAILAKYTKRIR